MITKKNHVLLISRKETFLIRAMEKKLQESRLNSVYTPWNIDDINKNWEGTDLVTLYVEEGEAVPDDVLHFLNDKLADEDKKIIAIGGRDENQYICDHIPGTILYKTFLRPLDNEAYIRTVQKLVSMAEAGEFKKTILVVDDDASYLGLVREWLKGTYKVAMANSGLQAIRWLGKNQADLILLDHEMPVTSGPQVLEMLRNDSETMGIPVMFLTGKSDKKSVMEVMSLKPQGYFLKSIEKDQLLKELADFFAKNKG